MYIRITHFFFDKKRLLSLSTLRIHKASHLLSLCSRNIDPVNILILGRVCRREKRESFCEAQSLDRFRNKNLGAGTYTTHTPSQGIERKKSPFLRNSYLFKTVQIILNNFRLGLKLTAII